MRLGSERLRMVKKGLLIRSRKQDFEPLEFQIPAIRLTGQRLFHHSQRLVVQTIGQIEIGLGQRVFLIDTQRRLW